jgi:hypothetical protein
MSLAIAYVVCAYTKFRGDLGLASLATDEMNAIQIRLQKLRCTHNIQSIARRGRNRQVPVTPGPNLMRGTLVSV